MGNSNKDLGQSGENLNSMESLSPIKQGNNNKSPSSNLIRMRKVGVESLTSEVTIKSLF